MNTKDKIPVILLFGPTAVGKTELLLDLFKDLGEVINADSVQVYKKLDIGSAKPTKEYINLIPHHLISVLEPQEQFSVADFVKEADLLVQDIYNRGKIPVISGGTAFYFKNFIYGLPKLPPIDKEIRDRVQNQLSQEGIKNLYLTLKSLDQEASNEINENDTYRVVRALEIYYQTGLSILSFKVPDKPRDIYNFLSIGLTRPREELYNRINQRVDIMFNSGLMNEFKELYKDGLKPYFPGMKGIGYSEFFNMMAAGCWDLEELKEEIRRNSRRYAKRQITFFNSFLNVYWVNPDNKSELKGIVEEFIQKNS